jgi:hypothetical protein
VVSSVWKWSAPSLFNSTVHIVTGLTEDPDHDVWTTFDDHGRHAEKWAPLDGPSKRCTMLLYTRTDLLHGVHDLGCDAFKSHESKEAIVRIMNKCGYTNPGLPGKKNRNTKKSVVPTNKKMKCEDSPVTKKDLASAMASIKADLVKLTGLIEVLYDAERM